MSHHTEKTPENADLALVSICGLCKSFNTELARIDILRDLDFKLNRGETVAVIGASGIGKSTFLHILGTLDKPDSGEILFKGENLLAYSPEMLARFRNRSLGFVFQFHHLLPEFSALENAMMPPLINGQSHKKAAEAAEELLLKVGLKDRLNHRVNRLSGGEQQRVALARALVMRPDMVLADEPTGNLDKRSSEGVHELLCELNKELDMTLVVVTHSAELAEYMSRRVTLLDGKFVETD